MVCKVAVEGGNQIIEVMGQGRNQEGQARVVCLAGRLQGAAQCLGLGERRLQVGGGLWCQWQQRLAKISRTGEDLLQTPEG